MASVIFCTSDFVVISWLWNNSGGENAGEAKRVKRGMVSGTPGEES